jgi:putative tryptophan/tyrosine transport system substrate-binding protein
VRRREFIALVGGAAAAWPLVARAQHPAEGMRRIGVLMVIAQSDPEAQPRVEAFEQGLRELGWISGHNIQIDYRWGAGDADRIRAHAAELVQLTPDAIFAVSTAAVAPLRQATRTVPIVFAMVADPVGQGFVESLARPGGNATGFTLFEFSIAGKWLGLLKDVAPRATRVALLFNPETAPYAGMFLNSLEAVAPTFGVEPIAAPARNAADIQHAIETLASHGLLMVLPDVFNTEHRDLIIATAARHNSPAVYPYRYFAVSGGLMSYGIEPLDTHRRAASYVDRILRGAKPADLPVQQPAKFELVVNLKTAKALGLDVPPSLLARADEVIE